MINGGHGNDSLYGNLGDDSLTGGEGNDFLYGGSGADILVGETGDDWLDGGVGANSLIGGTGDDTYVIDNVDDSITETQDAGRDMVLSSIDFVLKDNVEDLALTVAGRTGIGNSLANILIGSTGNDRLDGAGGDDTLIGGAGNDWYTVDQAGDTILGEDTDGGTDTVTSSVSFTLTAGLEILTLTGNAAIDGTAASTASLLMGNDAANRLTGDSGDDTLAGNGGGDALLGGGGADLLYGNADNDSLDGSNGIDTLYGGSGADTLVVADGDYAFGGAGNDLYALTPGGAPVTISEAGDTIGTDVISIVGASAAHVSQSQNGNDLQIRIDDTVVAVIKDQYAGTTKIETIWAGADTIAVGINQITGTASADSLVGTAGPDLIYGLGGNDTLSGLAGADTLYGGLGNDSLSGGDGADRLFGGSGTDRLYGGDGADYLDGGTDKDTLYGGAGSDTYFAADTLDMFYETVSGETDWVVSSVNYSLNDKTGGLIENIQLTNNVAATGNKLANLIMGSDGANTLSGAAGNDTLQGNGGSDICATSMAASRPRTTPPGANMPMAAMAMTKSGALMPPIRSMAGRGKIWWSAIRRMTCCMAAMATIRSGAIGTARPAATPAPMSAMM